MRPRNKRDFLTCNLRFLILRVITPTMGASGLLDGVRIHESYADDVSF